MRSVQIPGQEGSKSIVLTAELVKGTISYEDQIIEFDKTPIVTPNGDSLVKELNMTIKPGMHTIVTGPNGCGKSRYYYITFYFYLTII